MPSSSGGPGRGGESEFLSLVAHELRGPITAVMGLVDTLSKHAERLSAEEVADFQARIRRQAERLYFLVDSLLDASQVWSGRLRVSLRPVRLGEVAKEALEQAPVPPEKTATLDIPAELSVVADPRRLGQVLTNLLTNAYLHGGDAVRIEARESGDWVEVVVSDDGEGVPVELIDDLFERFTRGANATGRPGSGLGLAIAKDLVEAFGGRIRHEPGKPRGTRFRILLRSAPDEGSNYVEAGSDEERTQLVAKILVVEDEPDMRFLMTMILEAEGHETLEANHGSAAIERARESQPDLIITDIMMPVMDGRELIGRLRSEPQTAAIPILVVSAHTRPEVPGADAVLAKPFLPEEVLEAARSLLEREAHGSP